MITEKKARKKLENERDEQQFELEKLKENEQKTLAKMEMLVRVILISNINFKH